MDSSAIHMGPTVETYPGIGDEDNSTFLKEDPYSLISSGNFHKVPILIGFVASEVFGISKRCKSHNNIKFCVCGYVNAS